MGRRGPAPTPTAILNQRGSKHAKYERKEEPQVAPGIPTPLGRLTGKVRKVWDEHCSRLSTVGILTEVDGAALERYCRAWVKYQALAAVDVSKIQVETAADLAVVQNHTATLIRLSEHLLKLEVQYGMTPSSRTNVRRADSLPSHGNAKDKVRFIDMNAVRGR